MSRSAQRAVRHGEVASAERVVDHLADFHDLAWVGTSLTVDDNTKDDSVVAEPGGLVSGLGLGVVGGRDAVARVVGGVERAIVDEHATPGHEPPVDRGAIGEERFPRWFDGGVDVALALEVVRWSGDVPRDQGVGDLVPNREARSEFFAGEFGDGTADPVDQRWVLGES